MFYIFSALYCEASPIIDNLSLKKDISYRHFQVFRGCDDQVCLAITGAGENAAACAVSSVMTREPPREDDIMINFGTCGMNGGNPQDNGRIFICRRITEYSTGRVFYPDMIYNIPCEEAELTTVPRPEVDPRTDHSAECRPAFIRTESSSAAGPGSEASADCPVSFPGQAGTAAGGSKTYFIKDMEAAAIYQAALYFMGPQQMIFLKVISDNGDYLRLKRKNITSICSRHAGLITGFVKAVSECGGPGSGCREIARGEDKDTFEEKNETICGDKLCDNLKEEDDAILHKLAADMRCTVAMEENLKRYEKYFRLAGIDFPSYVTKLYDEKTLPCRDKKEGKAVLERIKRELVLG